MLAIRPWAQAPAKPDPLNWLQVEQVVDGLRRYAREVVVGRDLGIELKVKYMEKRERVIVKGNLWVPKEGATE